MFLPEPVADHDDWRAAWLLLFLIKELAQERGARPAWRSTMP